MSGTANLPVRISLDGVEDVNASLRRLADSFREPSRAAEALPPAVNRASESFNALETRTNGARRAVNDLRGAMELLGAGGAAGSLGSVASYVGNLADLFGTASLAAGRLEGVAGLLSSRLAALAGLVALPLFLQSVGLGINSAGEAATDAATATDRWQRALEAINPTLDQLADKARKAAVETARANLAALELEYGRNIETRGALIGQVSDLDRQVAGGERGVTRARERLADFDRSPPILGAAVERANLQAELKAAEDALKALQERRGQIIRDVESMGTAADQFEQRRLEILGTVQLGPNPPGPETGTSGGRAPRAAAQREDPAVQEARRLFDSTRTSAEQYEATITRLGELRPTLEQLFGTEGADEIVARRAEQALATLERAEQGGERIKRLGEQAAKTSRDARELGNAFASAFEDAVQNGKNLGDVLKNLEQDLLRLGNRKFITEPLGRLVDSFMGGGGGGGQFDIGKVFGNLGSGSFFAKDGGLKDLGGAAAGAAGASGGGGGDWLGSAFSWITSLFADGGIMTSRGPLPLQRYAMGGIADRPQLAMFGEGATPEAYVPLPDGRSIPVRMQREQPARGGDVFHFNFPNADMRSFRGSEAQLTATAARALSRARRNL